MTAYRQTPSLSEETIRLAESYFSQRRRKTRASILLPFVILIPVIIIGSIWGAKASTALFVPLTVSSIVIVIILLSFRRQKYYRQEIFPRLMRELYPGCTFSLLGDRAAVQEKLSTMLRHVFSGRLSGYDGSLSRTAPSGIVFVHGITESIDDGDDTITNNWLVYETRLPSKSPWNGAGYAQIGKRDAGRKKPMKPTRIEKKLEERLGRPVDPARDFPRSGIAFSLLQNQDADPYGALTEIPLSGTDQKLFSNRPDFHSDLLRRGGGAAIWEFVQTAGPDKTICYYGGSLFVFAGGDSLDTRQNVWKRFDPQEYIGNAVRILQTMDAVERLAQFIPGEDTAGTP